MRNNASLGDNELKALVKERVTQYFILMSVGTTVIMIIKIIVGNGLSVNPYSAEFKNGTFQF